MKLLAIEWTSSGSEIEEDETEVEEYDTEGEGAGMAVDVASVASETLEDNDGDGAVVSSCSSACAGSASQSCGGVGGRTLGAMLLRSREHDVSTSRGAYEMSRDATSRARIEGTGLSCSGSGLYPASLLVARGGCRRLRLSYGAASRRCLSEKSTNGTLLGVGDAHVSRAGDLRWIVGGGCRGESDAVDVASGSC